jgi:hypothetical protein
VKTPDAKRPVTRPGDDKPQGKLDVKPSTKPVMNPADAAGADLDGKQSSVKRPVVKAEARKFQPARKTAPPRPVARKVTP